MNQTDRITMVAQVMLTALLFVGFHVALYLAWFSPHTLEPERYRVIDTMVGVLGATFTMVVSFWFARQRNAVKEVPNELER
jgi:ABC-type sulfate transport system permease component